MRRRDMLALMLLPLVSSCARGPLSGKGYFGPFQFMVKTENGERLDDVIVTLSKVVASGESLGHTYKERIVTSTDVLLTFPRGYVSDYPQTALGMDYSVLHPFYTEPVPVAMQFETSNEGTIRLPDVTLRTWRQAYAEERTKYEVQWRKEGLTEVQISQRVKQEGLNYTERDAFYAATRGYFSYAAKLGRTDLVEKYLPIIESKVIAEEKLTDAQARALDDEFRSYLKKIKILDKW